MSQEHQASKVEQPAKNKNGVGTLPPLYTIYIFKPAPTGDCLTTKALQALQ